MTTALVIGMLLASLPAAATSPPEEAEQALAQAEVAVARARARDALWATAWSALLEARRTRIQQDYAASVRWSARAEELAGLGLTQAGAEGAASRTPAPPPTGEKP